MKKVCLIRHSAPLPCCLIILVVYTNIKVMELESVLLFYNLAAQAEISFMFFLFLCRQPGRWTFDRPQ